MTIKQRIAEFLQRHPEGVDDDEIARALNLSARQQANSRCRELEKEGFVKRRRIQGKIHNFWRDSSQSFKPQIVGKRAKPERSIGNDEDNWFWEGNVQATVVNYLTAENYLIRSVADTATRQHGKDIIAEKDGRPLWVTVKGYPKRTGRTHPSTQAGHWFKDAIFDVIQYRGENKEAEIAFALPDYPRYRSLAEKIKWLQEAVNFSYVWVIENRGVVTE